MRRVFEWLFYGCIVAPLALAAISQTVMLAKTALG